MIKSLCISIALLINSNAYCETYIDIKDIPKTTDCKVVVEVNGKEYEKFVKDCKLEENQQEVSNWFQKLIKK